MCELYGPWIQWLFVAGIALTGSHYKTDIISSVDHLRSDLVIPLVLCTVACNGWSTDIFLLVPQDKANLAEKG